MLSIAVARYDQYPQHFVLVIVIYSFWSYLSLFFWKTGFESGGLSTPSYIAPWTIIGNDSTIFVSTDLSSCFERNKVALRMDILCDGKEGPNLCPPGGVGVYNPGYWGMVWGCDCYFHFQYWNVNCPDFLLCCEHQNIEKGKSYKVVLISFFWIFSAACFFSFACCS